MPPFTGSTLFRGTIKGVKCEVDRATFENFTVFPYPVFSSYLYSSQLYIGGSIRPFIFYKLVSDIFTEDFGTEGEIKIKIKYIKST